MPRVAGVLAPQLNNLAMRLKILCHCVDVDIDCVVRHFCVLLEIRDFFNKVKLKISFRKSGIPGNGALPMQ